MIYGTYYVCMYLSINLLSYRAIDRPSYWTRVGALVGTLFGPFLAVVSTIFQKRCGLDSEAISLR